VAPISAKAGKQAIRLAVVFFGTYGPGMIYVAGNPSEEASTHSSDYGVTLDGIGSWVSDLGGTVRLITSDSAGASGTVSVQLTQRFATSAGPKTITVTGTWRCVKPADF
jgi:hypothetical protein